MADLLLILVSHFSFLVIGACLVWIGIGYDGRMAVGWYRRLVERGSK